MYTWYRDRLSNLFNATVEPFIVLFGVVPPGNDRENER